MITFGQETFDTRPAATARAVVAARCAAALCAVSAVLISAAASPAAERSKPGANPTVAAIDATAEAFAKAFNAGDAKAVAGLWTADGSLIDEQGAIYKGRKAIEDVYAAFFKEYPGARIDILVGPIEFPTPATAVEDGVSRVALKDGSAGGASRYTAVHVKEDGKWRMASVRESSLTPAAGYARTKDLEWLVGEWENKSEAATVRTSIRWIADKTFLQRDYTVTENGKVTSSGTQIIGWDPRLDQVRSWSFDSSGGNGTGLWTPTPNGWRIESIGVLADGTPTTSVNYVVRVPGDDSVFGWRSVDRRAGTMQLPDTREVVLDRVPSKQR
jgi:uncharacterized protein (TIGR02246 family)